MTYVADVDFVPIDQSDPGDVTAPVTAVDVQLGLGNTSSSGCEPEDFTGFPAGNLALLQRGTCSFALKAQNAADAGAVGVVIFNQGNTTAPDRQGLPPVTLTTANQSGIPVIWHDVRIGRRAGRDAGPVHARVRQRLPRDQDDVQRVGRDRLRRRQQRRDAPGAPRLGPARPGDQRRRLGECRHPRGGGADAPGPTNTVRFAWWGAEESGGIGSEFYVANLTEQERANIALYLNFDMVGSPNYVRFIYDGDGSAFDLPGPDGSEAIEALYEGFYADRGLASEPTQIDFRPDYAAFFDAGIPFGGVFTRAEGAKTAEQQAVFGGVAGQQYDSCYHQACDTLDNFDGEVLDLNSDAIAYSTLVLAMDASAVTGASGG